MIIPMLQDKRLVLAQNFVEMIKQVRSLSEVELLGHMVGFYTYVAQETGASLEQAIEALQKTWEEPRTTPQVKEPTKWGRGVPADITLDPKLGIRLDTAEGYWGSLNIKQAQTLAQRILETWPIEKSIR